jgi:hypothetical protein
MILEGVRHGMVELGEQVIACLTGVTKGEKYEMDGERRNRAVSGKEEIDTWEKEQARLANVNARQASY